MVLSHSLTNFCQITLSLSIVFTGENYKTDGYIITPKTMDLLAQHLKQTCGKVGYICLCALCSFLMGHVNQQVVFLCCQLCVT